MTTRSDISCVAVLIVLVIVIIAAALCSAEDKKSYRADDEQVFSVEVRKKLSAADQGKMEETGDDYEWTASFVDGRVPKFHHSILAYTLKVLYTATSTDAINERSGTTTCADRNVTLLASRTSILAPMRALGPYSLNQLGLGTLNLYQRINTSCVIKLLYREDEENPLCELEGAKAEKFLESQISKTILLTSGVTSTEEWSVIQLGQDDSYSFNEMRTVLLFSTNGLFAIFTVFISLALLVLCCVTKGSVLTKPSNMNRTLRHPVLNVLFQGMLASSVLLLILFLFSFAFHSVCFYMGTSDIDNMLFSDKLFSPYTIHTVFLGLTALVSFIGGLGFVPKKAGFSLKERFGLANLYTLLSVVIYHVCFVVVAMFVDFLTVLASLVILSTMSLLLVLSFASVINVFRNANGFTGFLFLVAVLDSIIMSLYGILITSLTLLVAQDTSADNKLSFAIVLLVSSMAFSFCLSIFVLIARKGYKLRNHQRNNASCVTTERAVENGSVDVGSDEEKKALVPKQSLVPREVEYVMLIAPKLMEAWNKSQHMDKQDELD